MTKGVYALRLANMELSYSQPINPTDSIAQLSIGITTGITDDAAQRTYTGVHPYNLLGQRVERPTRGIFIHNGKKVVRK